MSKKLTPLFEADVKPVHVGVYPTQIAGRLYPGTWYSKWDGRQWMADAYDVEGAETSTRSSAHQSRRWRGLASDPKASKP